MHSLKRKLFSTFVFVVTSVVLFCSLGVPTYADSVFRFHLFDVAEKPVSCACVATSETSMTIKVSEVGNYVVAGETDQMSYPVTIPYKQVNFSDTIVVDGLKPYNTYAFTVYKENISPKNRVGTVFGLTKIRSINIDKAYPKHNTVILKWEHLSNNLYYEVYRDGRKIANVSEYDKDGFTYIDNHAGYDKEHSYFLKAKSITDKKFSLISNRVKVKTNYSFALPKGVSGECKTFAYYTAVTAKSSPQYKLLNSDTCYTDEKTGIRRVGDCYCVALGSYYGTEIGTKYLITLSTGISFKAILCDQKADRHTNSTHQYAVNNNDIVEFYVERAAKPAAVTGDYGVLDEFKGAVVSIEKI